MNKKRVILVLRLIRNVFIGVLSSGWILLIAASINIQKCAEIQKLPGHEGFTPNTNYEIIVGSAKVLMVAAFWLTAVVVFWVLVVANRLWPICKKPRDEQTNN